MSWDDPWLPDPTELPRVLSRQAALSLGFSRAAIEHRLTTRRWRRVLPHTYLTTDTLVWDDRLRAALAFAGEGALLSGAAALCDLELRSVRRPSSVLVLVPTPRAPRSVGWVRVRPSGRPAARALAPGPARVSEARAIADLCLERRRLDDVRAVVTESVRRGVCDVADLALELRLGPQRGSAHLRQAIIEAGGGAWSAPEAKAATLLHAGGIPPFEQNARIDLPDGRWFVADFLWRDLRAILEIDSDAHHSLAGDADATSDRHLVLETLGYSVVHRTPRYVHREPEGFVAGIRAWLDGRARHLAAS